MPNYDVQIIDKHQHENNKHMLSYTNYFDKSGRKKRHKLAGTVNIKCVLLENKAFQLEIYFLEAT